MLLLASCKFGSHRDAGKRGEKKKGKY